MTELNNTSSMAFPLQAAALHYQEQVSRLSSLTTRDRQHQRTSPHAVKPLDCRLNVEAWVALKEHLQALERLPPSSLANISHEDDHSRHAIFVRSGPSEVRLGTMAWLRLLEQLERSTGITVERCATWVDPHLCQRLGLNDVTHEDGVVKDAGTLFLTIAVDKLIERLGGYDEKGRVRPALAQAMIFLLNNVCNSASLIGQPVRSLMGRWILLDRLPPEPLHAPVPGPVSELKKMEENLPDFPPLSDGRWACVLRAKILHELWTAGWSGMNSGIRGFVMTGDEPIDLPMERERFWNRLQEEHAQLLPSDQKMLFFTWIQTEFIRFVPWNKDEPLMPQSVSGTNANAVDFMPVCQSGVDFWRQSLARLPAASAEEFAKGNAFDHVASLWSQRLRHKAFHQFDNNGSLSPRIECDYPAREVLKNMSRWDAFPIVLAHAHLPGRLAELGEPRLYQGDVRQWWSHLCQHVNVPAFRKLGHQLEEDLLQQAWSSQDHAPSRSHRPRF